MTAVTRSLPCLDIASALPWDAEDWANRANKEVAELWNLANSVLTNVTGTNTLTAQVSIAGVLTPLGAYQDGQEFTLIPTNTSNGAVTINIDTLGNNNIVDSDGNALTASVCLVLGRLYNIRRVSGAFRVRGLSASAALAYNFPNGWLTFNGFQLSNDAGNTNDWIAITSGDARDSSNTANIVFAGITAKKMSTPWAAGSTAGSCLQSANLAGSIAVTSGQATVAGTGTSFTTDFTVGQSIQTAGGQIRRITVISSNLAMTVESTWTSTESAVSYKRGGKAKTSKIRVFCLRKDADGSGDIATCMTDTPNDLPAGYTTYRRIGYILTDSTGNANNIQFRQNGDKFTLVSWINDNSHTWGFGLSSQQATLHSWAPAGTEAIYRVTWQLASPTQGGLAISYGIRETYMAFPSARARLYTYTYTSSFDSSLSWVGDQAAPPSTGPQFAKDNIANIILTSTSDPHEAQFVEELQCTVASGSVTTSLFLLGWRDFRA